MSGYEKHYIFIHHRELPVAARQRLNLTELALEQIR